MFVVNEFVSCEVLTWLRGNDAGNAIFYALGAVDLQKPSPAKALALEFGEVDKTLVAWTEICIVQFFSVRATDCLSAITATPQVPLFAGAWG